MLMKAIFRVRAEALGAEYGSYRESRSSFLYGGEPDGKGRSARILAVIESLLPITYGMLLAAERAGVDLMPPPRAILGDRGAALLEWKRVP